jgi:hypothetical protein
MYVHMYMYIICGHICIYNIIYILLIYYVIVYNGPYSCTVIENTKMMCVHVYTCIEQKM